MERSTRQPTSARGRSWPYPAPQTRPSRWQSNIEWLILSFFHCRSSEPTLVVSRSRSATDMAPPIWASIACRHQAIASWRESEFSIAILWPSLSSSHIIDMARTLVGNPDHHWKWQKFLSSPSAVWVCPARSITPQWRLAGCRHWRHWWAADFPRSQLAARLLLLLRPHLIFTLNFADF